MFKLENAQNVIRIKTGIQKLYNETGTDLSYDNIFQSFTDPENPTPEEFTMFKIQYGVDWIIEPKDWNL